MRNSLMVFFFGPGKSHHKPATFCVLVWLMYFEDVLSGGGNSSVYFARESMWHVYGCYIMIIILVLDSKTFVLVVNSKKQLTRKLNVCILDHTALVLLLIGYTNRSVIYESITCIWVVSKWYSNLRWASWSLSSAMEIRGKSF